MQEHGQKPDVLRELQRTGYACRASITYFAKKPSGQFLGTLHILRTTWLAIKDQSRLLSLTALSFPVHHLTARGKTPGFGH